MFTFFQVLWIIVLLALPALAVFAFVLVVRAIRSVGTEVRNLRAELAHREERMPGL